MQVIVCPKCKDTWEAKENFKKCKCFRCGFEYKPTPIFMPDFVFNAIKRVKG